MLRPFGPYAFSYISPVARFACALLPLRLKPPLPIFITYAFYFFQSLPKRKSFHETEVLLQLS